MTKKRIFDRVVEEDVDKNYGIKLTESARVYLKEMKGRWDATYSETIAIAKIILGDAHRAEVGSLIDPEGDDEKEVVADFFYRKIKEFGVEKRVMAKMFDED